MPSEFWWVAGYATQSVTFLLHCTSEDNKNIWCSIKNLKVFFKENFDHGEIIICSNIVRTTPWAEKNVYWGIKQSAASEGAGQNKKEKSF